MKETPFRLIPVNLEAGEVPVYNEFLVENRTKWIQRLEADKIESRPFYPYIDKASYFGEQNLDFPNSRKYGLEGIYLPSGPGQTIKNVYTCIEMIKLIADK